MKKLSKLLASLLALLMLLCLLPAAALADEAEEATEEAEEETAEEAVEEAEAVPEAPEAEEAAAEEPAEPVTVAEGERCFAAAGEIVFNNAGTVFNNGATVYNNGGTVYNNSGTVYNNAGTVYANGGLIYNNAGTVHDNGAEIRGDAAQPQAEDEEAEEGESAEAAALHITLDESLAALVTLSGAAAEGGSWAVQAGEEYLLSPVEGCQLLKASISVGNALRQRDGSYLINGVDADAELTVKLQAAAPIFSLAAGTYNGPQELTMTAAEGAEIYYTLDGSAPDANDSTMLYDCPVKLEEAVTVTAVAILEGAEPSKTASAAYAVPVLTAPVFEAAESSAHIKAVAVSIDNPGSVPAVIKSVALSGDNAEAFRLSTPYGYTMSAGVSGETNWTVRPIENLADGVYEAVIVFTFNSGDRAELPISLTIGEAAESLANPWTDCDSLEEATELAGFACDLPAKIAGYKAKEYRVIPDELLEIVYRDHDEEVVLRKAAGEGEDISGVYETFTETETDDSYPDAEITWQRTEEGAVLALLSYDGYSWSLYAPDGFDGDSAEDFLQAILG